MSRNPSLRGSNGDLYLEYECGTRYVASIISGSTTLMGFGIESVIEVTAASTLYWRLRKERNSEAPAEKVERRALRIVAVAFLLL